MYANSPNIGHVPNNSAASRFSRNAVENGALVRRSNINYNRRQQPVVQQPSANSSMMNNFNEDFIEEQSDILENEQTNVRARSDLAGDGRAEMGPELRSLSGQSLMSSSSRPQHQVPISNNQAFASQHGLIQRTRP